MNFCRGRSRNLEWVQARANLQVNRLDYRGDAFMTLAYLHSERGVNPDIQRCFGVARSLYEQAIAAHVVPNQGEPVPQTKLAILLSSPLYREHDLKQAFHLFDEAMQDSNCQHAAYWRGRALMSGFGTDRNTMLGFELIQQAAGNGVFRAKLATASLLEKGCEGENGPCVRKNPVMAEEYYRSISIEGPVYGDQEWVRDYALSHLFQNDEQMDKDDALGLQVGNVLSWEFAGQAFLFGAAGSFPVSDYWLLPFLGIGIGILSLLSSGNAFLKNLFRRMQLRSLFVAKAKACDRLIPRLYLPWWHCLAVFAWHVQAKLGLLADAWAVLLSLFFIAAWAILAAHNK